MKKVLRLTTVAFIAVILLTTGAPPTSAQTAPPAGACLASACSVPIASSQLQNLSQLKEAVTAYYKGGSYAAEVTAIEADATRYIDARIRDGVKKPAIVLDIDDTALLTIGYELDHDYGFDNDTWNAAAARGFPAIPSTLALVQHAKAANVAIFFVTGRRVPLTAVTQANLVNAGYPVDGLTLRPIDDHTPSVVPYKSGARAAIEARGFTVLETIGDQFSDLNGGHAERAYKLPNPMYFIL